MKYTYKAAGVDVARGDEFANNIKNTANIPSWIVKEPTGYATIINFTTPMIAVTADGIGTKILLHIEHETWDDAARDLIAMNYNDLICVGAKPLAFLDYLGLHKIDENTKKFITSLIKELERHDMYLIAGETAEMPDLYMENHMDAAGFAIGKIIKLFDHKNIKSGDYIMALDSSGFHSNGWSLIRKIIKEEEINIEELPFNLLEGTKIYSEMIKYFDDIKAIAHVTGGGILRALKRLLGGFGCKIQLEKKDFVEWILKFVDFGEAILTFNMGYGLLFVTEKPNSLPGKIIGKVNESDIEIKI
ncbi:phosphoribosylaminoimidazole synthetase [Thermosipho melanesiensis]|uniref:Phosphoribosylformylglycinamidine cyclo-ligase n=2 Tax=Thermosipho melanesiensis TaxID=46541 RepID=A6LK03_THEM4|nr:AIR synthase-related protein [Thermosipho melanesiensis]ABR30254.1 Phosphoribosylformylglycinamidine cyclo-ligase [Thermosipho melanesiensis BI429]APT73442.1 phosphoribosylaminoimidazole synthetase [Thermosipho melanesiensis]OOC37385.1 phosphoribosylaminoimidazole synthetase [Thermosipho melanesiensis]OOC39747.1 phosphoribosylaminoimidazole synthetase [Thermosipho melanesiensis]OOC39852.1 phosphoribosylaminoimidazole synthetase [Thermosipho melanesiensis]